MSPHICPQAKAPPTVPRTRVQPAATTPTDLDGVRSPKYKSAS